MLERRREYGELPEKEKEKRLLVDPEVFKMSQSLLTLYGKELAELYHEAWAKEGLSKSPEEALGRLKKIDMSETFVLRANETNGGNGEAGEILAMVNTLPLRVQSLRTMIKELSTYEQVLAKSKQNRDNPGSKAVFHNARVCFSIVTKQNPNVDYRAAKSVKGRQSEPHSLSRYLLSAIAEDHVWRVAYSRMKGVKDRAVVECAQGKNLGPVGMHERFGALRVAIIEGGRKEDISGRGANVLAVYPRYQVESDKIKLRAQGDQVNKVAIKDSWLDGDSQIYFFDTLDLFGREADPDAG